MTKIKTHTSERMYGFLVELYPKQYKQEFGEEMKYIFAESYKEKIDDEGQFGVIKLWLHVVIDTIKSLISQHWDYSMKGIKMKVKTNDIFMNKRIFQWIALVTGLILMLPLIAMQFSEDIDWGPIDFIAMGILIFGVASLFVVAARKVKKHRLLLGALFALMFLYFWAELAVGIFTNLGS